MVELYVRRKSWSVYSASPSGRSKARLAFDQPLKGVSSERRDGNRRSVPSGTASMISCASCPIGRKCSRLFLVNPCGNATSSPSIQLRRRAAISPRRCPVKMRSWTIRPYGWPLSSALRQIMRSSWSDRMRLRGCELNESGGTGDTSTKPRFRHQFIMVRTATKACFCSEGVCPSFSMAPMMSERVTSPTFLSNSKCR